MLGCFVGGAGETCPEKQPRAEQPSKLGSTGVQARPTSRALIHGNVSGKAMHADAVATHHHNEDVRATRYLCPHPALQS